MHDQPVEIPVVIGRSLCQIQVASSHRDFRIWRRRVCPSLSIAVILNLIQAR